MKNTLVQEALAQIKSHSYTDSLEKLTDEIIEQYKDIIVTDDIFSSDIRNINAREYEQQNINLLDCKVLFHVKHYMRDGQNWNSYNDVIHIPGIKFEVGFDDNNNEIITQAPYGISVKARRLQDKADHWRNGEKLLMNYQINIWPFPKNTKVESKDHVMNHYRDQYTKAFIKARHYFKTGEVTHG